MRWPRQATTQQLHPQGGRRRWGQQQLLPRLSLPLAERSGPRPPRRAFRAAAARAQRRPDAIPRPPAEPSSQASTWPSSRQASTWPAAQQLLRRRTPRTRHRSPRPHKRQCVGLPTILRGNQNQIPSDEVSAINRLGNNRIRISLDLNFGVGEARTCQVSFGCSCCSTGERERDPRDEGAPGTRWSLSSPRKRRRSRHRGRRPHGRLHSSCCDAGPAGPAAGRYVCIRDSALASR